MSDGFRRGEDAPRRSRPARLLLGALVVTLVAALAFWAGRVTLRPPDVAEQAPPSAAWVEVVEQDLGRTITLTTTVNRPSTPLALNALSGVVTSVSESSTLGQGDELYRVGDTPVLLVAGDMPFWRDLSAGARGDDVRQIQQMLNAEGASLTVDGIWSAGTTQAVRAWQREHGAPITGAISLGEVVARGDLPVEIAIDTDVAWPGAVLAGGEIVAMVADGEPTFVMEVTPEQAAMVPTGTLVTVHEGDASWEGAVADSQTTDAGARLAVTAADGGPLCADQCDELPASGTSYLLTDVTIIPPVTGPVIPIAALSTQVDGTTSVDVMTATGEAGVQVVHVVQLADGLAVVEGVELGQMVRVFGSDPGNVGSTGPEPSPAADE